MIFEKATTQYSQIVSNTVIDEAREFSAQVSDSHGRSKEEEGCNVQRDTATDHESFVEEEPIEQEFVVAEENEESQPVQGIVENAQPEIKTRKRKLISLRDTLDELENEIVGYEKQSINSVIEEKMDMKKEFLELKKETLDRCRKGHAINIELDVCSLMSLSNIFVVTRIAEQPDSKTVHLSNEATKVRQAFFLENLSDIRFNDDTYKALKAIIDKYLPEEFEVSDVEWEKVDLDCKIELLQLAKKANIYDRAGIEAIINFLTYSSNHNIKLSSESHLESNFVHPIVYPIFKSSISVPHSSNKSISKQKELDPSRRPDYVSDCHYNREFDFTSMFGELKHLNSYDQLDLYRIAYFCQKTMHENGLKMSIGFQTKRDKMRFFAMQEQFGIDFFIEVANTHVPLRRSDVKNMLLDLNGYSRLSYLQRNYCISDENLKARKKHPVVDMHLFKTLIAQDKKTKN
ncbi:uncharacterized protein EV154DRAFT_255930 [Mucor mucedo]|nr:uncharacterized protein EV154DRAFT_255930 [Mucor mucedo]KAI7890124.1 hypothetical protein EV154DRAFT_255930 [Mucor mucedo]